MPKEFLTASDLARSDGRLTSVSDTRQPATDTGQGSVAVKAAYMDGRTRKLVDLTKGRTCLS